MISSPARPDPAHLRLDSPADARASAARGALAQANLHAGGVRGVRGAVVLAWGDALTLGDAANLSNADKPSTASDVAKPSTAPDTADPRDTTTLSSLRPLPQKRTARAALARSRRSFRSDRKGDHRASGPRRHLHPEPQ